MLVLKMDNSYLKELKFLIKLNWLSGYFPFSFNDDLFTLRYVSCALNFSNKFVNFLFYRFAWMSSSTVFALLKVICIIFVNVVGYHYWYREKISESVKSSGVHKVMMTHEFIFNSIVDFTIFVSIPAVGRNVSSLVTIFKDQRVDRKSSTWRMTKCFVYSLLMGVLFSVAPVKDIFSAEDMKLLGLYLLLTVTAFIRALGPLVYDILLYQTTETYEDFIDSLEDDLSLEKAEVVLQICNCIQDGFGVFLLLETSKMAIFFTIWAYLFFVDFSYVFCTTMAVVRLIKRFFIWNFNDILSGSFFFATLARQLQMFHRSF